MMRRPSTAVPTKPTRPRQASSRVRQRGAAVLLAMLTVALVATLSATAYWQQWQAWAVERAQQQHAQAAWLLSGALDWTRLILREDARASQTDHLAEPWAVPLQEARLNTFLAAAEAQQADRLLTEAFLSGHITDLQARLNLRNLVRGRAAQAQVSLPDQAAAARLFSALGLPEAELGRFAEQLLRTLRNLPAEGTPTDPAARATDTAPSAASLLPQRWEQLEWLGLSGPTLQQLAAHATWLPEPTPLNLNTASALVIQASVPGLDLAQAQRLVQLRQRSHFERIEQAAQQLGPAAQHIGAERFAVSSRYFLLHGQLRLDDLALSETALVVREGINVRTVWRQRGSVVLAEPSAATGQ